MKNLLFCALVLTTLLCSQSSDAQVRLGVQAGLNASDVKFDSGPSYDLLLGLQGGLTMDIGLSPKLSIRPSLLYTTKGFSTDLEFRND